MTVTVGASVPVNSRVSVAGKKFCYAKFLDQTTTERVQNPDTNCGNRDPLFERTAPGRRRVMFSLSHDITVPILDELLPLAGLTLATSTWTANQSAPSKTDIVVDKVGAIHRYTDCFMTRMIIRGQTGTLPCSIETQWIAEDEVDGSAFSWVDGTIANIFAFPGMTYSISGTPYTPDRFAFIIDNKLIPAWNNSATLNDIGNGPRQTLLAANIPYKSGTKAIYWDNKNTITAGLAQVIVLTNGINSVTINVPNPVFIPDSPSIEGSMEEIRANITWEAHRTSSVPAFNIVKATL